MSAGGAEPPFPVPGDGHPTVEVPNTLGLNTPDGGRTISIDVALAPLIEGVWKRGVPTLYCCQEEVPGFALIQFPTVRAACGFLRATGLDDPTGEQVENYDSLEARCNGWDVSGGNGGWAFPWEWRWSINLDPRVDDVGAVSLHFPTFDLPALIARLNGWSA